MLDADWSLKGWQVLARWRVPDKPPLPAAQRVRLRTPCTHPAPPPPPTLSRAAYLAIKNAMVAANVPLNDTIAVPARGPKITPAGNASRHHPSEGWALGAAGARPSRAGSQRPPNRRLPPPEPAARKPAPILPPPGELPCQQSRRRLLGGGGRSRRGGGGAHLPSWSREWPALPAPPALCTPRHTPRSPAGPTRPRR
jgi:hypothetical protein